MKNNQHAGNAEMKYCSSSRNIWALLSGAAFGGGRLIAPAAGVRGEGGGAGPVCGGVISYSVCPVAERGQPGGRGGRCAAAESR